MSTPTAFNYPTLVAAAVAEALQNLERKVQTPELDCFSHIEHDYKYECEQEHQLLMPVQVDRLRNTIADIEYHQVEIDFYRTLHAETVYNKIVEKHKTNGEVPLDGLLEIKAWYKRALAANGLTGDLSREKRLDITDQRYWKPEAQLLQQKASLRRYDKMTELARKHAKAKARKRSMRTPPKNTRRSSRIASRTANAIQPLADSKSSPKCGGRITGRVVK